MRRLLWAVILLLLPASALAQAPQAPATCDAQLGQTAQYAFLLKGARDQCEVSLADLRQQLTTALGKVSELEKKLAEHAPKPAPTPAPAAPPPK